ncbi:hypothetical protein FCM35_KLT19898 [Carex littledalei]|uniref:Uncharacterized protein n=1 Tax=Carex littledalei TaxID=544730 RepID=A0A833RG44_9POAL|nr:hypothetical protein FCM35_KLT19898 [Carex littledalei]
MALIPCYRRSNGPAIGVAICISVAIGAPAFAGLYNVLSPLGKDYDLKVDEEAQQSVSTVTAVTAPFFIFNLAAVNIDNEALREALGITGIFSASWVCYMVVFGGS